MHLTSRSASRTIQRGTVLSGALSLALLASSACGTTGVTASSSPTPTTSTSTSTTASTSRAADGGTSTAAAGSTGAATTGTAAGLQRASWGTNVKLTFTDGYVQYQSDGLPNHKRSAEYALPTGGGGVPSAATATAGADPTKAQSYTFKITTNPSKAAATTPANQGTIGVMISGAALFNPYEGDGSTVATKSNFTVKNAAGQDVAFLDECNGHPSPMGSYHYHGLPSCVTASVDSAGGPSHLLGLAFDGFPIYGNRDMDGREVTASALDACNGLTSPTPEFPAGIYHYVLLDTADASSSIRCFSGTVDASLTSHGGPPGMPGAGR